MTNPTSPPRVCEHCDKLFAKPYTISRKEWSTTRFCSSECKNLHQIGRPNGKLGWRKPISEAQFIPCRICGEPTKYAGSPNHPYYNLLRCNKPTCIKESKQRKNESIKTTALRMYADGTRRRLTSNWDGIIRVSAEELLLKEKLEKDGWQSQYKFLTGLEGLNVPRTFWLDFAKPEKRLCLEIDGSVHRLNHVILKDRRRDGILRDQGWQVLRITSKIVRNDPESFIKKLSKWDEGTPPLQSEEPKPKKCEICNRVVKNIDNRFCSSACASINHGRQLKGKPSKRKGIKTGDSSKWSRIPCRICGQPTKIAGTPNHPRWKTKACDKPECQAASKLLTRQNQSKALKGNEKLIDGTKKAWARRKGPKVENVPSVPSD